MVDLEWAGILPYERPRERLRGCIGTPWGEVWMGLRQGTLTASVFEAHGAVHKAWKNLALKTANTVLRKRKFQLSSKTKARTEHSIYEYTGTLKNGGDTGGVLEMFSKL